MHRKKWNLGLPYYNSYILWIFRIPSAGIYWNIILKIYRVLWIWFPKAILEYTKEWTRHPSGNMLLLDAHILFVVFGSCFVFIYCMSSSLTGGSRWEVLAAMTFVGILEALGIVPQLCRLWRSTVKKQWSKRQCNFWQPQLAMVVLEPEAIGRISY